jgi:hypothetical protein
MLQFFLVVVAQLGKVQVYLVSLYNCPTSFRTIALYLLHAITQYTKPC